MAIPDLTRTSPQVSRGELIDRFLALQPRLRHRFSRALPTDLSAEIGGVTVHQMAALHAIARNHSITMGALAGCLQAGSLSTATQMADRLVKLGLVERSSDPEDRRLVRLALSPRGRGLLQRMEAAWRQGIGEALEGLDDPECASLVQLLERVAGAPIMEEQSA